jgi:hypothetical protein
MILDAFSKSFSHTSIGTSLEMIKVVGDFEA